jgi:flagellar protein FlbD
MIQLTRLNNQPLMVNSDLIKFVEKAPDTVLTLVNGEKVIVLESAEAILEKIVAFRRSIMPGLMPQSADDAAMPLASEHHEAARPAGNVKET